jgi:hypothetical protein
MTRVQPKASTPLTRLLVGVALASVAMVSSTSAYADDALGQCIAASDRGIDLRKQGKLIDARKSLATCAVAACGVDIKESCEKRLTEINAALPTIIFVPKSGVGGDIGGVKATMDGTVLAEALDGRPFTVDPGRHTFRFELAGQAPVEKTLVLSETEKDRRETIVIGPLPAPVDTPTTSLATPTASDVGASSRSNLKTAGYVVAGAGIVGIAVGSVFGILAISDNNAAGCDANSFCANPSKRTAAQGVATGSTVGFVAGGVLLAGGVVLVLVAPKHGASTTGRLEVAPMVGGGNSGLLLRGAW